MDPLRRAHLLALTGLALPLWPARAQATGADAGPDSPMWPRILASVFDGRPVLQADARQLRLQAPARAVDPAFVPVTVRSGAAWRRLTLVVDNNPAPVAATLEFGPRAGPADIETRLRVDAYSMVRAVAEQADGVLWMSACHVKAAGGCSAPAGTDAVAAEASLGRMQLRVEAGTAGQPVTATLQISHPNHSGLAMDPLSRLYTPAHFVRTLDIRFDDERVLQAELDFALSENPSLRFQFSTDRPGVLRAEAQDSLGRRFSTALAVVPA